MLIRSFCKIPLILCVCITLGACKSTEDRAEEYFASAQELIEVGDLDRAIIELRNVFQLMPAHAEARRSMAQVMMETGNPAGAYNQYVRLVEQLPDDVEGRTALAELAFVARNWDEFIRHGERVVALEPDALRSQSIGIALQYREAILEEDDPAIEALAQRAENLAAEMPGSNLLEQILFDSYMRANNSQKALAQLDAMIARTPQNRGYYDQRLLLLQSTGDRAAMETHLRDVIARFPEDVDAKSTLVQFLMITGDRDGAETFLRSISDPTDLNPTFFISLVQFLMEVHGIDTARAELEAALDVSPQPDRLRIILAALDFEDGQRDAAIADLQAVLNQRGADTEALDVSNEARIALSRMLVNVGNDVGAQRLVDEVLEADGDNVAALKMRAVWLIAADDTNGAIADLRRALDVMPDDVQALGLMAEAYIRAGSHDLARDFLAQAVDVSGNAPEPSLRYARVLVSTESYISAEDVLLPALRRAPQNAAILALLSDIYLATEDFARASMGINQLRRIGSEESEAAANQLQAQLLARQQGTAEALAFLEEMAVSADAGLPEKASLLRARLSTGEREEALRLAQELVAEAPEDPERRFLLANTLAATGNLEAAQTSMRALVTEDPTWVNVWQQLYQIVQIEGDAAAASALLDEALEAAPEAPVLLWAKAGELERAGEIDATIAIYEDLYSVNSASVIFANNLASLLVTYKDDSESLERAWTIARRLRGTDVPAFQDTYGWLAFRRGDPETALPYLESAAAGLPQDPIVQYHLAEVYTALDRPQDALVAYQRALDVAKADDIRPQIIRAQEAQARLQETGLEAEKQ